MSAVDVAIIEKNSSPVEDASNCKV